MSSSSICLFWKKLLLILCLNVLTFFADFNSDGRLFHVFGPMQDRHFGPVTLVQNGNSNSM